MAFGINTTENDKPIKCPLCKVVNPPDSLLCDYGYDFQLPRQNGWGRVCRRRRLFAFAGLYWATAIIVFVVFDLMGYDMFASGAIPVVIVTLPSSLVTGRSFDGRRVRSFRNGDIHVFSGCSLAV